MKKLLLFLFFLSLIQPCFGQQDEAAKDVLREFFNRLKAKNYSRAAELFAPELQATVSPREFDSQIREVFQKGIPLRINPAGGLTMTQFMAPGEFKKLLRGRKEQFPGGELWVCTAQCEKGKLLFRVALDEKHRIAAYQLLPVFEESQEDFNYDYNMYYVLSRRRFVEAAGLFVFALPRNGSTRNHSCLRQGSRGVAKSRNKRRFPLAKVLRPL